MWSTEDGALVVRLNVALRPPAAVGVNTKEYVQLAFTAKVAPQVELSPKSPAFVPVMDVELIVSVDVPVFVRMATCGFELVPVVWFPNVTVATLRVTCGVGVNPTP
jgi:hypothetical protein